MLIHSNCKLLISDAPQLIVVEIQSNYEMGKIKPIIYLGNCDSFDDAIDQERLAGIVNKLKIIHINIFIPVLLLVLPN